MRTFPKRSPGVLLSPMADRAIAYDLITETAHQLNASAGEVLAHCDGETLFDETVEAWALASESASTADLNRDPGNPTPARDADPAAERDPARDADPAAERDPARDADPAADPPSDVVRTSVESVLLRFDELGLVGRDEPFAAPDPPIGSSQTSGPNTVIGSMHRVIDHAIAFRSIDQALLRRVDEFLGTPTAQEATVQEAPHPGAPHQEATIFFDLTSEPSGEIVLQTDFEWRFPSLHSLLAQLCGVFNEYAVWTHSCAALHAGGVCSPRGEVVLLPAPSGYGKSTLTGALVAAGWDYLGDEAIGVRADDTVAVGYPKRLSLDAAALDVLGTRPSDSTGDVSSESTGDVSSDRDIPPESLRSGVIRLAGDVGPVSRVVLPRFVADAETSFERLAPEEAIVELLANTLNLAYCGQTGLDALCDLAATVPVYRLEHGDVRAAVEAVEAAAGLD